MGSSSRNGTRSTHPHFYRDQGAKAFQAMGSVASGTSAGTLPRAPSSSGGVIPVTPARPVKTPVDFK